MDKRQIAIKLALLVLLAIAPFVALTLWVWPGAFGVAFYGILAAAMSWIVGGTRVAALSILGLATLSIVGILCHGNVLATGILVLTLGVGYGVAASKGLGPALLQVPILTPYFAMEPPALFSQAVPTISASYLISVALIVAGAGLWLIFLLHLALPNKTPADPDVPERAQALIYGALLGLFSAAVVAAADTLAPQSHWAWITMTVYVLANPNQLLDWQRLGHRVIGTALGFLLVFVIFWLPVPNYVTNTLVVIAVWLQLYSLATKKPYWVYVIFLTTSVVSMASINSNHDLFAAERIEFTVIGAVLAVAIAFMTNLILHRRPAFNSFSTSSKEDPH